MADDRQPAKTGTPSGDDSELPDADEREIELLLRHGRAFRQFINEAREIERIYLEETKRRPDDIRAAGVYLRRSLKLAASQVGGFKFDAAPVPLNLIFQSLNDVQAGHYGRVTSPSKHQSGESYETLDRRKTIGLSLAVWHVLKETLGLKSSDARDRTVKALNDAGFKIPKTRPKNDGDNTFSSGKVTADAIAKWRTRAGSGEAHYADVYQEARMNLKTLLQALPVEEHPDLTADNLISYLTEFVRAHRINE